MNLIVGIFETFQTISPSFHIFFYKIAFSSLNMIDGVFRLEAYIVNMLGLQDSE